MFANQKVCENLCSKPVLEKAFGSMSKAMYFSIMSTLQNEFENIVNNDMVPSRDSFIQCLATTVEFHRNRFGDI